MKLKATSTFCPRSAATVGTLTIAIAAVLVSLSGCNMAPDYRRPDMALPAQYKESLPANWQFAQPSDDAHKGNWWQQFNDPMLDQLMTGLEASNQNLAIAQARWRQASALSQQARASLFPTIGVQASATRSASGSNSSGSNSASNGSSNNVTSSGSNISNSTQVGGTLSWEADIWGRVRQQANSQSLTAQSSLADLANTRLSLQAELAIDYFSLRVASAQDTLLKESVAAYKSSLELTRNRYAAGVATKSDVSQAETQWLSTSTQLADNQITVAQLEHAIAALLGKPATGFSLAPEAEQTGAQMLAIQLPSIPVELPASLLERRPDIASAERQVAAANASIGVARAALFPVLNLSADAGYRGSNLSGLFDVAHQFWSLGPSLALTVFDAGAKQAAVDQARASFDQASANYRQTVLTALQGVEDQLVALRLLQREADLQKQAVASANVALNLVTNQYRAGTVPYLNVLSAQQTQQNARSSEINIRGRQLSATVQLLKGLGGGWQGLDAEANKNSAMDKITSR
ncbi:NodT family efflux transporter outer membrane factor (OMF) lipoprotein [Undibacterium sp. GrIS 1.8]|uniref:efflux transporter outer membrane subunit n=1 Tax=unclassified Undibacterium TaxID=2630295 RepID=UPI0033957A97